MAIQPGKTISLEITKAPTNEGARKTLLRLARKDPAIARLMRKQAAQRPSWQEWRRGNATWHHQMKTQAPVTLSPGNAFSLRATVSVLRDLASVERFVKVTAK